MANVNIGDLVVMSDARRARGTGYATFVDALTG